MDGAKSKALVDYLVWVVWLLAIFGCISWMVISDRSRQPLSESDIPGTYQVSYLYGTETLTLRSDGTYDETFAFRKGHLYRNSGRWVYRMTDDGAEVMLEHAFVDPMMEPPTGLNYRLKARGPGLGGIGGTTLELGDSDGRVTLRKMGW